MGRPKVQSITASYGGILNKIIACFGKIELECNWFVNDGEGGKVGTHGNDATVLLWIFVHGNCSRIATYGYPGIAIVFKHGTER